MSPSCPHCEKRRHPPRRECQALRDLVAAHLPDGLAAAARAARISHARAARIARELELAADHARERQRFLDELVADTPFSARDRNRLAAGTHIPNAPLRDALTQIAANSDSDHPWAALADAIGLDDTAMRRALGLRPASNGPGHRPTHQRVIRRAHAEALCAAAGLEPHAIPGL